METVECILQGKGIRPSRAAVRAQYEHALRIVCSVKLNAASHAAGYIAVSHIASCINHTHAAANCERVIIRSSDGRPTELRIKAVSTGLFPYTVLTMHHANPPAPCGCPVCWVQQGLHMHSSTLGIAGFAILLNGLLTIQIPCIRRTNFLLLRFALPYTTTRLAVTHGRTH